MNESKTRVYYLPEEKFDFLGYTFGRCYSMRLGRVYLGMVPSKKRVRRICRAISDETGRDTVRLYPKAMVEKLNRMSIGWANYFCLGPVGKADSAVDLHTRIRLRRWLCDKRNEPRPGYERFPEASLPTPCLAWSSYHTGPRAFRGRPRESSESRMREICQSGSMSGNRKQNQAKPD